MTNQWDIFEWDNRRNLDYHINNRFTARKSYQKLEYILELKHIRHKMYWSMKSRFVRTYYNSCWNARYEFREGDV